MNASHRHAERIEQALACNEAARNAVVASWQRSRQLYALDPSATRQPQRLSDNELARAREALGPLLTVAASSLDRLFLAVGNVGCCVLLADAEGVPVARRGASVDDTTFENWGLWTGAVWSEASEGTNGIGTCIAEKRPVTIHKSDHFRSSNTSLSCMGAPIFDHLGRLAAVIDVSSCRADLTEEFSRLIAVTVMDAACRIETEYFRQQHTDARFVFAGINAQPPAPGEAACPGPALLAVDGDDLVVGATRRARRLYGLADADLMGQPLPLATLTGEPAHDAEDYQQAEYKVIQRALLRARGNVSAAARAIGISRSTLHRKLRQFRLDE